MRELNHVKLFIVGRIAYAKNRKSRNRVSEWRHDLKRIVTRQEKAVTQPCFVLLRLSWNYNLQQKERERERERERESARYSRKQNFYRGSFYPSSPGCQNFVRVWNKHDRSVVSRIRGAVTETGKREKYWPSDITKWLRKLATEGWLIRGKLSSRLSFG